MAQVAGPLRGARANEAEPDAAFGVSAATLMRVKSMPILLWLLGVPLSVIILLLLFGFLR
jgi:hypothetical protein